jgi:2-polyprenyl-3-methyl-5-hydroxy-6-metoxy-1,4-benzoquinol methylase
MNRQQYFANENYLDFKTGYPERDISWFEFNILPNLIKHIPDSKKRMLDVGCASGYFTNIINNHICIDGCDFTQNKIEQAKKQFPHIHFYQLNLTDNEISLPVKYDFFFSNAVLPHIPINDKPKVFENLASVANKDAIIILYDQLIDTGIIDDFVGLFSVEWLNDNATQWEVISTKNICRSTDEVVLRLKNIN